MTDDDETSPTSCLLLWSGRSHFLSVSSAGGGSQRRVPLRVSPHHMVSDDEEQENGAESVLFGSSAKCRKRSASIRAACQRPSVHTDSHTPPPLPLSSPPPPLRGSGPGQMTASLRRAARALLSVRIHSVLKCDRGAFVTSAHPAVVLLSARCNERRIIGLVKCVWT